MLFNSVTFLVFFAGVILLDRVLRSWTHRKVMLLVASYLFYAAWNPPFVVLIWISTFVDWHAARWLHRAETPNARRLALLASLTTNLGLLAYFKYGGFALDNLRTALEGLGVAYQPPDWNIVLPVGISFYTFQTLSYTIDVYRRTARPWHSPLDFALFVTFFPQLVAGPIVRAFAFLPQLAEPRRATRDQLGWGLSLLTIGLFEKMVLADRLLAVTSDVVFRGTGPVGFVDAWTGTLAFAGQIFCDFAGYSTCAIGAALCLGFHLPTNFRFPYAAVGFSDFWRRWHVSLSEWLRDYLYISLGGNRIGPIRTYVNLSLTMLLGGLWHGAAWTFVAWGALHGAYLVVERGLRVVLKRSGLSLGAPGLFAGWLGTFVAVLVAWVFFRAPTFGRASEVLAGMVGLSGLGGTLGSGSVVKVAAVMAMLLIGQWLMRDRTVEGVADVLPWWAKGAALGLMLATVLLLRVPTAAFLYFQF